jgi:hypothetical protein
MATPQRHRPHHHHTSSGFHQGARQGMGAAAGLVMLVGVVLGVFVFGLMALSGYASGSYQFTVIGLAAIGGLLYGLYSFFRNPT